MTDVYSTDTRSYVMSKVKSYDTKPEILIRKFLYASGLRFRKNYKALAGKPDLYVLRYKVAIFFHGCFWHGHPNCKHSAKPKSNNAYWQNKILKNMERDVRTLEQMKQLGIKTIVIWGCEIDTLTKRMERFSSLLRQIKNNLPENHISC